MQYLSSTHHANMCLLCCCYNHGKSITFPSTGICYYSVVVDCKCNSYPCDCEGATTPPPTTTPPPITETFSPTASTTPLPSMYIYTSLVPRPRPAFRTESDRKLGGAWERGYIYTIRESFTRNQVLTNFS